MSNPAPPAEWYNSDDYGSYELTVTNEVASVHISDDVKQRHYRREIPLAQYATETETDGWMTVRDIVRKDFLPEQVVEIEAHIAAQLARRK